MVAAPWRVCAWRIELSLTKLSLIIFIGGLVWLGAEYVENRKHPNRLKVPSEAELSTVSGKAVDVRVVERKTKKGVVASRYTELDVQAPEGLVTVRVGEPHLTLPLGSLKGETVIAGYDRLNESIVFSLSTPSRKVIAYRDTADFKAKVAESNSGGYTIGWIALVLGGLGLWFGRKSAAA